MTVLYCLTAIFCSPLYFLLIGRKKMALLVHLPIYLFSLPLLFLFGSGFIFLFPLTLHSTRDLRGRLEIKIKSKANQALDDAVDRQAKAIAREMKNVLNP